MTPSRRELVFGTLALVACDAVEKTGVPRESPPPGPARGTVYLDPADTEDTGSTRPTDSGNTGPDDSGAPDSEAPPDTGESAPIEDPDAPQCEAQSDAPPETCEPTTTAGEGPFYREGCPEQTDLNPNRETGTKLILHVRVLDASCQPRAGVRAYMWHATQTTRYDDVGWQGRGNVVTDADGRLCFETLYPGVYTDVSTGLDLPAHLHWRFVLPDGTMFTTQFNFEGDPALAYTFHSEDLVCALETAGSGLLVRKDVIIP